MSSLKGAKMKHLAQDFENRICLARGFWDPIMLSTLFYDKPYILIRTWDGHTHYYYQNIYYFCYCKMYLRNQSIDLHFNLCFSWILEVRFATFYTISLNYVLKYKIFTQFGVKSFLLLRQKLQPKTRDQNIDPSNSIPK